MYFPRVLLCCVLQQWGDGGRAFRADPVTSWTAKPLAPGQLWTGHFHHCWDMRDSRIWDAWKENSCQQSCLFGNVPSIKLVFLLWHRITVVRTSLLVTISSLWKLLGRDEAGMIRVLQGISLSRPRKLLFILKQRLETQQWHQEPTGSQPRSHFVYPAKLAQWTPTNETLWDFSLQSWLDL